MKRSSRGRGAQRQVVIIILLLLLLLLLLFSEVRERKKEKKKRDSHVSAINCAARCSPSVRWRPGYYLVPCVRALLCSVRVSEWNAGNRAKWSRDCGGVTHHRPTYPTGGSIVSCCCCCLLLVGLLVCAWTAELFSSCVGSTRQFLFSFFQEERERWLKLVGRVVY